tara:strand:- start:298 stop:438 length:141 start_codon:yes stop_codon:yes gene_type:complete
MQTKSQKQKRMPAQNHAIASILSKRQAVAGDDSSESEESDGSDYSF